MLQLTPLQLSTIPRAKKCGKSTSNCTALDILEIRQQISKLLLLTHQVSLWSCTQKWTNEFRRLSHCSMEKGQLEYRGYMYCWWTNKRCNSYTLSTNTYSNEVIDPLDLGRIV